MQQQPRLPLWFLVVNWALILTAFLLGTWLGGRSHRVLPEPQRSALEIVYEEVLKAHIDPPDRHELLERAIAGMVDELDEYSHYYPPSQVASYDERSSGEYQGIGAKVVTHEDEVVVHFPFPDGPAAAAGLLPGDVILAVDGKALDDAERRARVTELLRGPTDSEVSLRIRRADEPDRDVTFARGSVLRPCVKWARFVDEQNGLGYVHLKDFHPTAAKQLFDAIEELQRQRPLRGLILDLRFDPGGSLDQCLTIARAFLDHGLIATQHRRDGPDEVYRAIPAQCRWPDLPLVLLVNENSASASEVLSGALQDHGRAVVVGKRTHGKGYVNTVSSWSNHGFKLKLTTGSYRTPSGRNIERNQTTDGTVADHENGGIVPDVVTELDKEQRLRTYDTLRHVIEVPAVYRDGYAAVAKRYGFEVEAGPSTTSDPQLTAAIDALKGLLD